MGSGAVKAPCRVSVCTDNIFRSLISALVSSPHSSLASSAVDSPGPTVGVGVAIGNCPTGGKLVLYDVEPNTGPEAIFLPLKAFLLATASSSNAELPLETMRRHLSHLVRKQTLWFPNRFDTSQTVQQARSLKFPI